METIRLIIYEDKTTVRDGLCEIFEGEQQFQLLGAFPDCSRVVEEVQMLKPHVVLMDKEMPRTDGLQGLILIKQHFPDVNVIMLTNLDDDESIFKCLQMGASGYIKKGVSYLQLFEYIKIVHFGGTMMSPGIAAKVRDFFREGLPSGNHNFNLTPKELEALTLLCNGLSQKLIASRMNISVNGVAAHLKSIFKKLQVNSATEAVSKSFRLRIIPRSNLRFD